MNAPNKQANIENYLAVGLGKFLLLNLATFGLYSIIWWYLNWRGLDNKPTQQSTFAYRLMLICKALLSPIFCVSLFNRVGKSAERDGIRFHWDPLVLGIVYISCYLVLLFFALGLIDHFFCLFFGFFASLSLIPIQMTINSLQQKINPQQLPNQSLTPLNLLAMAVGSVAWVNVIALIYFCSLPNTVRGTIAIKDKSYQEAFYLLAPEADAGNPRAQALIAYMYANGLGMPKDSIKAVTWYGRAAAKDLPQAYFALGELHYFGEGLPQDYQRAMQYYQIAADKGVTKAKLRMAIMYEYGLGKKLNLNTAHELYFAAADEGDRLAQYHLGLHNLAGVLTPIDPQNAAMWFEKSANRGLSCAQKELAVLYASGQGVKQDPRAAASWLKQVALRTQKNHSRHHRNHKGKGAKCYVEYMLTIHSHPGQDLEKALAHSHLSAEQITYAKKLAAQQENDCAAIRASTSAKQLAHNWVLENFNTN